MKKLDFTTKNAALLYKRYMKEVRRIIKKLSKDIQNDILMEVNSHIYESLQRSNLDTETERLEETLEKLGSPNETFTSWVAEYEPAKKFKPVHTVMPYLLKMGSGFIYLIYGVLGLNLLGLISLIVMKISYPHNTGLFIGEGIFHLGYSSNMANNPSNDLLGYGFIPLTIMAMLIISLFFIPLSKLKSAIKNFNNSKLQVSNE